MKIAIIGAGYVGLITGAGLASQGHKVVLVDIDREKVTGINHAQPHIYEEGLEPLLKRVSGKSLTATDDTGSAVRSSDVVFICVSTYCQSNGCIDLVNVKQSAANIGRSLRDCATCPIIVVKSTVIPGTTEEVVIPILEKNSKKKAGRDFGIAVNPEFLKEGKALNDFYHPDRIIIGERDKKSGETLAGLYRNFDTALLRVTLKTAEMIKYASNAFLATKISFINEIGNICKMLGIDVYGVAEGMGLDPRISRQFLQAGLGYGGSCLPKDIWALIAAARKLKYDALLLKAVCKVNERQPLKLVELARQKCQELQDKKVTVLGLSFKPGTDDIREASSFTIIKELLDCGSQITVYDPLAMPGMKKHFKSQIAYADSAEEAIREAEVVFITTEWGEFRRVSLYRGKKVFDGRRLFSPEEAAQAGLDYEGICW